MGIPKACFVTPANSRITLHQGDLTLETVDVIVNAANSTLTHGGGVAGAIVHRGGYEIQEACTDFVTRYGPVPVGQAIWSGAGGLPIKGLIHTVGPTWGEGSEPAKLRSAALSAFALAAQREMETLALPAISSGIFGFPKKECAEILIQAAYDFLHDHPVESLQEIRFVIFDEETVAIFSQIFVKQFGSEVLTPPRTAS